VIEVEVRNVAVNNDAFRVATESGDTVPPVSSDEYAVERRHVARVVRDPQRHVVPIPQLGGDLAEANPSSRHDRPGRLRRQQENSGQLRSSAPLRWPT
jgi:hypothetical protein